MKSLFSCSIALLKIKLKCFCLVIGKYKQPINNLPDNLPDNQPNNMQTFTPELSTMPSMFKVFSAWRGYKARKTTKPLNEWKRKGMPRNQWCGTKTTFSQRTPKEEAIEDAAPKRKYVQVATVRKCSNCHCAGHIKRNCLQSTVVLEKPKRKLTDKMASTVLQGACMHMILTLAVKGANVNWMYTN